LGTRKQSREFALQVLYQSHLLKQDAQKALTQYQEEFLHGEEADAHQKRIVLGVLEHRKTFDELIEKYSQHWHLERIDVIDRNILRMALFELFYCDDIPPKVTINEAIDLGKKYGSKDSGSFINGILDRIQNEVVKKPVKPEGATEGKLQKKKK
jgi:N utilization substance protein B